MTEIRFYHLMTQTLDRALPQILGKAYESGRRVVVQAADTSEAERLNVHLWTFHPGSFLPHGGAKDGNAEDQPIWVTDKDENPNGADVLILTGGTQSDHIGDFALCCEMFDGRDQYAVAKAREKWKVYKEQGHNLSYWQQDEAGRWSEKQTG